MMSEEPRDYYFQTTEFAISSESFHYLRNGYNYKTLPIKEVKELVLEKGRQVNNWLIILVIGIGLIGFSLYHFYSLFNYITDDNTSGPIFIESFVIPIIPLFLGVYSLYVSLKIGPTLKMVLHSGKTKHFALAKANKDGSIDAMLSAINESTYFKSIFRNHLLS